MSTSSKNVERVLQTLDVGQQIRIITEDGPINAEVSKTDPQLRLKKQESDDKIELKQQDLLLVAESQTGMSPITSIEPVSQNN